tara:strand:- start:247 stop:591 length:345 start_codon:yes stop_codon:yes gene_type:complete
MAAVALNTFKTIRYNLTDSTVGIYTAPIGVASIIISAQVANVSTGTTTYLTTFSHYRASGGTFDLIKDGPVPANDALLPIGSRLVLETDDEIRISANENNVLSIVMSVLETAKG